MSYCGKPLIVMARPWWRHPAFPWGWYSLTSDFVWQLDYDKHAEGCYRPGDGGGGTFRFVPGETAFRDDDGRIVKPDFGRLPF